MVRRNKTKGKRNLRRQPITPRQSGKPLINRALMRVRLPDERPPRVRLRLQEARVAGDYVRGRRAEKGLAERLPGDGRPVLVIPGMFAADRKMRMLRRVLDKAGYASFGWDQGRNMPHRAAMLDRLDKRLSDIIAEAGKPVTLIGWVSGRADRARICQACARACRGRDHAWLALFRQFAQQ
jgi:hypothetical protein